MICFQRENMDFKDADSNHKVHLTAFQWHRIVLTKWLFYSRENVPQLHFINFLALEIVEQSEGILVDEFSVLRTERPFPAQVLFFSSIWTLASQPPVITANSLWWSHWFEIQNQYERDVTSSSCPCNNFLTYWLLYWFSVEMTAKHE